MHYTSIYISVSSPVHKNPPPPSSFSLFSLLSLFLITHTPSLPTLDGASALPPRLHRPLASAPHPLSPAHPPLELSLELQPKPTTSSSHSSSPSPPPNACNYPPSPPFPPSPPSSSSPSSGSPLDPTSFPSRHQALLPLPASDPSPPPTHTTFVEQPPCRRSLFPSPMSSYQPDLNLPVELPSFFSTSSTPSSFPRFSAATTRYARHQNNAPTDFSSAVSTSYAFSGHFRSPFPSPSSPVYSPLYCISHGISLSLGLIFYFSLYRFEYR